MAHAAAGGKLARYAVDGPSHVGDANPVHRAGVGQVPGAQEVPSERSGCHGRLSLRRQTARATAASTMDADGDTRDTSPVASSVYTKTSEI